MARHHDREVALKVLFEHDLTHVDALELVTRATEGTERDDEDFVESLVYGVVRRGEAIDQEIEGAAIDWHVGRMATIDRNILRLATYELMESSDVPISVVIDEALELAQVYSTDQAKKFINGILGKVAQHLRPDGDQDRLTPTVRSDDGLRN